MIGQNWIGCDVSKATLDFFDAGQGRHWRIANTTAAISDFAGRLRPGLDFVVMDATGSYDRVLRHRLADAGIAFSRHNPEHTHHFSKSTARRASSTRMIRSMPSRKHGGPTHSPPVRSCAAFRSR